MTDRQTNRQTIKAHGTSRRLRLLSVMIKYDVAFILHEACEYSALLVAGMQLHVPGLQEKSCNAMAKTNSKALHTPFY